jgi:hypothetical protein
MHSAVTANYWASSFGNLIRHGFSRIFTDFFLVRFEIRENPCRSGFQVSPGF